MSEWKVYNLGEIASVQTGPFGSQLHQSDYVEVGTPIITVEHLGENRILHNNLPRVNDEDKSRLKKYWLQEDDIVFSRVGSVDRRAYVKKDEDGWLFSGRCLRVRPLENVNGKFLSYFFGMEDFKSKIRAVAVGATMPSLNTSIMKDIEVTMPDSIETQTQIAQILTSLDDKIELNLQMNQTLEAMAQALFKEWFVNFNFPNFDGELENDLPKGWRMGKLNEVAKIEIGRTPPRLEEEWFSKDEKDNKWISIRDMGQSGIYIFNTSEYLTNDAIEKFRIPVIPENTVVLSFKLTIGRLAITTEKMLSNEAIAQINSTEFPPEYIYLYLKTYNWGSLGSTSSIATAVNSKTIKEMEILIPDTDISNLFKEVIRPIFEKIKYNSLQIQTLTQTRDTLLPKLMNGKIEIV
jgi:type I restriction enzyme S subunit